MTMTTPSQMTMMALLVVVLVALFTPEARAFSTISTFAVRAIPRTMKTPTVLCMSEDKEDRETAVERLMKEKELTKEQAEKEYDLFNESSGGYTLEKGEEYYKSLGYSDAMQGILREADKEGKGDEIRAELEEFKQQSSFKAMGIIAVVFAAYVYAKLLYFSDV